MGYTTLYRDRDSERRDRDNRDNKGSSRSNRDREVDEDESYERRKRERRLKERSQAFVEVVHFQLFIMVLFILGDGVEFIRAEKSSGVAF